MGMTAEQAKTALSENIEARLNALGWSKYRLAKETGITEQTIRNICSGTYEPRISLVTRIALALRATVDELLGRELVISEKLGKKIRQPA